MQIAIRWHICHNRANFHGKLIYLKSCVDIAPDWLPLKYLCKSNSEIAVRRMDVISGVPL